MQTRTNSTERRNRETHNYSWRFQHPSLLTIDRTTRYEIRKDIELSNIIKKQNLITVYIILHLIIAKYVYFSSAH